MNGIFNSCPHLVHVFPDHFLLEVIKLDHYTYSIRLAFSARIWFYYSIGTMRNQTVVPFDINFNKVSFRLSIIAGTL